jgi:hypothetical protein
MKKLILSLFSIAAIATGAKAQVSFGPEIGLNIAEYKLVSPTETSYPSPKYSLRAGGIVDFGMGDHFSIQTGAYYVSNGWVYSDGYGDNETININTVEVPLNFIVKIGRRSRFWIGAGGYAAFYISGTDNVSGTFLSSSSTSLKIGSDSTSNIKGIDAGYSISIGWQLPMGLFVRAHFNEGLLNLQPMGNSSNSITSASYGTTIGWLFGVRRGPKDYLKYYR